MNYKDTTIGFAAPLNGNQSYENSKPQIGFTARLSKGLGDPSHEPCIGFHAKLREAFVDTQLELAFDVPDTVPAQKTKAGAPAPAF